ncbi:j domain-containing protein [Trichonephila inaurata madagascariensis]|uniref:J domain-containing protein n=1 Tax=Trichonephila inaurata madagascariensis TaxID=2747483 RepID=A0A8X6Y1H0_9ARAC|nr:j domain-containing protein [Trichonephila inaurata madagascariensis]
MLVIAFRNPSLPKLRFLHVRQSQLLVRYSSDDKPKDTTLYDSLGLKSSATSSEIKKAYYDLTFKYHPDRNEGSVDASHKFRKVTEAYEILGNYGLRKRYDKGLPLPNMKSKTSSTGKIEETVVKYQKFFDSRSQSQKTDSTSYGLDEEFVSHEKDKMMSDRCDASEKTFEKSKGVEYLLAAVLCSCLLYKYFVS